MRKTLRRPTSAGSNESTQEKTRTRARFRSPSPHCTKGSSSRRAGTPGPFKRRARFASTDDKPSAQPPETTETSVPLSRPADSVFGPLNLTTFIDTLPKPTVSFEAHKYLTEPYDWRSGFDATSLSNSLPENPPSDHPQVALGTGLGYLSDYPPETYVGSCDIESYLQGPERPENQDQAELESWLSKAYSYTPSWQGVKDLWYLGTDFDNDVSGKTRSRCKCCFPDNIGLA